MNIHEYQAKAVLREFGVPVPRGHAAFSVDEAVKAATDLGSPVVVVKAQIHAGGRGKAGGGKVGKAAADGRRGAQRTAPGDFTPWTPPALPRPPAWICALTTTTGEPSWRAAWTASSTVKAGAPRGTGTPKTRNTAFA